MTGKIPQDFISDLVSRIDIVDVISARLQLRKAGRDFVGRCPFHDEKTPSFTVSQSKQFYHCFGCGAHGTVIGFLMDYDRMDFVDAVHDLARQLGLEVPHSADQLQPERGDLYALVEQVARYYRHQLARHREGERAVRYLKERGLTGEIAREYGLGYAPGGWDNLVTALAKTPAQMQQLIDTGLVIRKSDSGAYDRFRDRIMFPIRDRRGRVVGFGGRVLGNDTPKYLNSPETTLFHKGKSLYGLFEAGQSKPAPDFLLVVEGYMDVIALAQHKISCAVAALGTAATQDQIALMFRRVARIVMCFDGDNAGRSAAWRALQTALPLIREGRELDFVILPAGEDPDSLIRQEGEARFLSRIDHAIPLSRFLFDHLTREVDLSTVEGRARLVELARPMLSKIPEGVFRQMMFKQLAETSKLEAEQLQNPRPAHKPADRGARKAASASGRKPKLSPVRLAITILLQQPGLARRALTHRSRLAQVRRPGMALLCDILELLESHPHMTVGALIEHWRGQKAGKQLARLAQSIIPIPEDGLQMEFDGAIERLLAIHREQETEHLLVKAQSENLSAAEKTRLRQLLSRKGNTSSNAEPLGSA